MCVSCSWLRTRPGGVPGRAWNLSPIKCLDAHLHGKNCEGHIVEAGCDLPAAPQQCLTHVLEHGAHNLQLPTESPQPRLHAAWPLDAVPKRDLRITLAQSSRAAWMDSATKLAAVWVLPSRVPRRTASPNAHQVLSDNCPRSNHLSASVGQLSLHRRRHCRRRRRHLATSDVVEGASFARELNEARSMWKATMQSDCA